MHTHKSMHTHENGSSAALPWFVCITLLLGGVAQATEADVADAYLETAPGVSIAYRTEGDPQAEAIVIIPGTSQQLSDWPQAMVDGLVAEGFYVVRFDNRDVGGSTKLDGVAVPNDAEIAAALEAGQPVPRPYDFADLVADTIALMDALDIDRAHVVAMSMGGAIAQLLALDHPERVASLTLIAADSGNPELPFFANPEAFAALPPVPPIDDFEAYVAYQVEVGKVLAGSGYPAEEAVLRANMERSVARGFDPAGIQRQEFVSLVGHLETAERRFAGLALIAVPTVVVQGTDDPLVPVASAEDIAAMVPGAELRLIPGLGHDLPEALADEFVAAVLAAARGGAR